MTTPPADQGETAGADGRQQDPGSGQQDTCRRVHEGHAEPAGRGVLHGGARRGPGAPEIFKTDQGSRLTNPSFTGSLRETGIRISLDSRGRCMVSIFIERLWRALKDETVCLHEIADGFTARRVFGAWAGLRNTRRPHEALGGGRQPRPVGTTRLWT